MSDSVFTPLGDGRFLASEISRGPWSLDHQHGGAPTALAVRELERVETFQPMRLVRITCEIIAPVPIGELAVTTELIRPGKRVQWAAATITADGKAVLRANALFMRVEEGASPAKELEPSPQPGPSEELPLAVDDLGLEHAMFAPSAVEIRIAEGKASWLTPGPGRAWFRLKVPLVEGEEPSTQQRAVAAADFGNGISAPLPWGSSLFVNSDLSMNLLREPVGEWISLDSVTRLSGDGTGLTESRLADQSGGLGVATQSLFVTASSTSTSFG